MMYIKYFFLCIFCILLFVNCSEPKISEIDVPDELYIKYKDSTFVHPIDSFYVKGNDTTYYHDHDHFLPEGYFVIYRWGKTEIDKGRLANGMRNGLWRYYHKKSDDSLFLYKEENYNEKGLLDGPFTYYYDEGSDPSLHYFFRSGNLFGIQEERYPSGALLRRFETDSSGHYIHHYLVLTEEGDTLYYDDFGLSGTGCARHYTIDHQLEWEQSYKNKKLEGWSVEYSNVIFKELYKNNELVYTAEIHSNDAGSSSQVDSITYSAGDSHKKYYYQGRVVKSEKL